jgi:hypothetical protein
MIQLLSRDRPSRKLDVCYNSQPVSDLHTVLVGDELQRHGLLHNDSQKTIQMLQLAEVATAVNGFCHF